MHSSDKSYRLTAILSGHFDHTSNSDHVSGHTRAYQVRDELYIYGARHSTAVRVTARQAFCNEITTNKLMGSIRNETDLVMFGPEVNTYSLCTTNTFYL